MLVTLFYAGGLFFGSERALGALGAEETLRLFAEKVIPQMRGMWKDYEDHWYPRPMPLEDRAIPRQVTVPDTAAGREMRLKEVG